MSNMSTRHESFEDYFVHTKQAMESLLASDLEGLRTAIMAAGKSGSTLWVAGNGGSASTASHFVADMVK